MGKLQAKARIIHILEAIHLIQTFVKGIDEETFVLDVKLQSAVQFQFLVIGEALKQIDTTILSSYDYPWHIPKSFRNFIIHEYHGVKMERVFYAANDLSALEGVLSQILDNEPID